MEEQINNEMTQTEQVNNTVQENNPTQEVKENNESPLEGQNTEVKPEGDIVEPKENEPAGKDQLIPSDEIQKKLDKLAEYEVKEKEVEELRNRLGVKDNQDDLIFNAQRQMAIIENQAQQEYIKLCNQYGVDYRPEMIDKSAEELKAKDPQAFFDLKYKLLDLTNGLNAKKTEIENFIATRDISLAMEKNKTVFEASPAIRNVIQELVKEGGVDGAQIDNIVKYGLSVAQEAFEMGRQAAMQGNHKTTPAEILNNNVITQQTSSIPTAPEFTLKDVEKMDLKTYAKNKNLIDKLYAEGRLK